MDKNTILKFKKILEDMKKDIIDNLRYEREMFDNNVVEGTTFSEEYDLASAVYETELQETLEKNELENLQKIEDALRRIDEGSFGICESCGSEIEVERLEFLPYTTLCKKCANNKK